DLQRAGQIAMRISGLKPSRTLAFCFLLCLFAWANAQETSASGSLKGIGTSQNVRSNGELADGYSVSLWSWEGKLVGFLSPHRGLMGDPPMGMLADIEYDSSPHLG
ncbi:MAG: hypothetical protein P8Z37_14945, partial [Acidobacteriota bacterium]